MSSDAFGNYDPGAVIKSGATSYPFTSASSFGGTATPTANPGVPYAIYTKTSNGAQYYWDGSVWHVISGGGGGGTIQVVTGAFANPNSNVTLDDPTKPGVYYQQGGAPNVWRWDVTDQVWYQTIG